ncbi:DUF2071 domain-containing protein [Streptomyces sp. NBC_00820]|uniref:YqjF family protein n=1 Tax=Streptomyces sp. NBC_00820 TaxID=2975842 RepID=UPI002ED20E06|nr:DUF2071 domain-containing protein [Streptomyces sp. NBC_00820]
MVSYGPELRVHVPALCAGWLTQTFVHWPYPLEQVRRLVPDGLVVDTFDDTAWVSLTAFVMAGLRPPVLPAALPGLPDFPETNLRTYVRRPDGREGLWFLSLEVGCPAMLAARAVGAPFHVGRLDVDRQDGVVTYTGSRGRAGPSYRLVVRPGERLAPSPRDVWLTSRWRAYTKRLGVLWETPVEHPPFPLRHARLDAVEETLTRAAGLPPPGTEPLAHYCDGIRQVRLGGSRPAHPVRGRADRYGKGRACA